MEPTSNTRNTILFIVLSCLILAGSQVLQSWLSPPKPKLEPAEARLDLDPRAWADLAARTAGATATGQAPLGALVQAGADAGTTRYLAARNYQLPKAIVQKPAPAPTGPKKPPQLIAVGNDQSKIKAVLTSRGGAIASLTLAQFKAAGRIGRPLDEPLELLPADENRAAPSFALYDYARPDEKRPDDTLGQLDWTVESNTFDAATQTWQVVFATDVPDKDIHLRKTFTLTPNEYHLGMKVEISRRSQGGEPLKWRYQVAGGHGVPIEGQWYASVYRNALVGGLNEQNQFWRDFQDSRSISHKDGGDQVLAGEQRRILWAGVVNQFFASATVVDEQQPHTDFLAWARPTIEDAPDPTRGYLDDIQMRVVSKELTLKPGDPAVVHQYLLYNGPVKIRLLADSAAGAEGVSQELVDRYTDKLYLDKIADWQFPTWISEHIFSKLGWTYILIYFTNKMHSFLAALHMVLPNWGLCILVLTVMVRALLYPISRRQAMASKNLQEKMKVLQPELKKLKEKYKNDFRGFSQAQHDLYRRHNVNPLAGVGGCLPVLLQMPIFMGLYYCLQESIHFRLAPFLWIENLAAPDMLIWWSEKIPWISDPANQGGMLYLGPYFNLLPVLAVTLMIVQQQMLTPPPADETQEMQFKMMKYMMVFFGLMFYKVAAGLCLYFIVSSLWGLTERKLLPKLKPMGGGTTRPDQSSAGKGKPGATRKKPGKADEPNGKMQKVLGMWDELLKQAKKK